MSDTKRFLVIIGIVLWCLCSLPFAHAQQCSEDQYAANTIVIKKKGGGVPAAGGGCNVSTDFIGEKTTADETAPATPGYAFAYRAQASCSGNLESAYVYHGNTTVSYGKVCVYLSTQATPHATNDTKVGCSGEIQSTATIAWFNSAIVDSPAVTVAPTYYWVIFLGYSGTDAWSFGQHTDGYTAFYAADADFSYASPPAAMGAGWGDLTSTGSPYSYYVRIQ